MMPDEILTAENNVEEPTKGSPGWTTMLLWLANAEALPEFIAGLRFGTSRIHILEGDDA
jgi:hypothetical protein